jgi:hypothetical protein
VLGTLQGQGCFLGHRVWTGYGVSPVGIKKESTGVCTIQKNIVRVVGPRTLKREEQIACSVEGE